jgi:histidine ammonia-lyase
MQEDHVSMGWSSARKLRRSIDGAQRVVAIELLTAARAVDLRFPLTPSAVSAAVVATLRENVPAPGTDRYLAPEISAAVAAVQDGSLLAAAEAAVRHAGGELV